MDFFFYTENPLVSVQPEAIVLFITVSSLPQAISTLGASPSHNDQM